MVINTPSVDEAKTCKNHKNPFTPVGERVCFLCFYLFFYVFLSCTSVQ